MIDYKALAERVAQRAIYADNNADPNNKAWAADLRAVVSLLNGMADAQPVAWRVRTLGQQPGPWRAYWSELRPCVLNPSQCEFEPLYTHPAPAVPQAEPKREPLPGLAPTHRCPACGALWRQCDDASWNLRSALCCGLCDAGRVELVRLVNDPKREPLSDERITKGEYVLATKWGDGDPGDHWGVGFYDRLENGRHYVVDSAGKQIRGNGFRRVGRITADVGRWLLSAAKSLEASPPGTVNLWTMLTERAHGIGGSDAE